MDSLSPIIPRSSLPLQICLWFDGHLTWLLTGVVLALLVVKPYFLQYTGSTLQWEFMLMLSYPPIQGVRNWFGTAGNKQERASYIAVFLWCSVWTVFVTGYFMKLQAYGIRLECELAFAALGLAAAEVALSFLAGIAFCDNVFDLVHLAVAFGACLAVLLIAFLIVE
mmetsp:Transcript_56851/g.176639  ORF Transcript_56851/g.176639 Transcript_56851/m.176639 type:complete len:167 (-) Transcript_56851:20-520(-)